MEEKQMAGFSERQSTLLKELEELLESTGEMNARARQRIHDKVWQVLVGFQGYTFETYRGLQYKYEIRGFELFVSRKEKSVTRSSVEIAVDKALERERIVTGPKQLKVFGASYLYPVFQTIGFIKTE
ncbi:MAG: hypothetical protein NC355_05090 [Blautia sp.]|nr:hypothetical protein [Blautia sp.]